MEFELDEELNEVAQLAKEVFASETLMDRLREIEKSKSRFDGELWNTLATTGLLSISVAEEHGGAGLGLAGLSVLLEEQGRHVAPVPLWSHAIAAHSLEKFGSDALAAEFLPAAVEGKIRLALALEEFDGADPAEPGCTAEQAPDGSWRLSGTKALVPSASGVDQVVVSASSAEGAGLFLVDARDNCSWELVPVTTHDLAGTLQLNLTPAIPLGQPGDGALTATLNAARVALAALQLGVSEGALAHATSYMAVREQFGRPLGTFQAVQHQMADCFIDIEAMRVTLWQAVSDIDITDADADFERSALVAKWWCDQAGLDVVHRVQHIHGGMGVDVDYPVHRHFLWGKQIANTLGGAEDTLAKLGTEVTA